jgi:hypothetical protein
LELINKNVSRFLPGSSGFAPSDREADRPIGSEAPDAVVD